MATAPPSANTLLLLDNDVFTLWRNQSPNVVNAVRNYTTRLMVPPKLPAVTIFEAQWGIEKEIVRLGGTDQNLTRKLKQIEQFIQTCGTLDFNHKAASIAAYIFARLSKSQRNEHWRDVFIAATALAHNHGVATKNQRDFELIGQHLPPYAPILYLALWKS